MLLYSIVILVTAYIDGIVSMAVNTTEIRQFEGFRCSMQPENTSLPCTQYVIKDPQYCNGNDEDLKRLFPGLYSIDDATGMGWPGPIRHESVVMDHADISWTAPQDGNVNFLKGYQVVQLGNSYFNLNMRVCTIIDLTHVTKEDFKTLTNTTFTIFNTSPGTVEVTIKPLPFPPDILLPAHIATMPPPPMQVEYHPQLNVFVDYDQINNSTVNISMFIDPVLEELHTLTVLVDSIDRGQRVGTMSVSAKQKYFTIGNLTMGAYKLEFIPSDDSEFGIISPCLCYTGTSDSRNCVPCRRYPKIIYVAEKVYDPSTNSTHDAIEDGNSTGVIVTLVLVPMVLLLLTVGAILFIYRSNVCGRNGWFPFKLVKCMKRQYPDTGNLVEMTRPFSIQLVFSNDHRAHVTTVKTLADLLRNVLDCNVSYTTMGSTNVTCEYGLSEDSLSSAGSDKTIEDPGTTNVDDVDLCCVVNSEWAYKLTSVTQTGQLSTSDLANAHDRTFLDRINDICHNSTLNAKTVSLMFEYTSDSYTIRDPFLGPLFKIPSNIDALLKHVRFRQNHVSDSSVDVPRDRREALVAAVNSVFAYESKNKLWLATKMFYLRHSAVSDDSGVVIPRRNKPRVRSRSADTVTSHTCQYSCHRNRPCCVTCHQHKDVPRLRSNSCNFSFYAPDTDDTSMRLSLLETRFVDINNRYTCMVNNNIAIEDDCFTLDGQSI